jgi:hypothetical protein
MRHYLTKEKNIMDINLNEFKKNLAQFTGSLNHHRFSPLSKSALTDGSKFVADQLQAYWLFDAIASHIDYGNLAKQDLYCSKLSKSDHGYKLEIQDGDYNVLASQSFEYTDFPLDSIEIWTGRADGYHVHYLPTEH